MLKLLDLQSFLVLILAGMWFEENKPTTFTKEFGQAIVMINLVAIVQFFEAIYTSIFKPFLIIEFFEGDLLEPVLTYFEMAETNS